MNHSTMLTNEIVRTSTPFADTKDFSPLIDMCKDKKIVMLGESTHGTKEFYEWRSLLTAELIQHHGFEFIAVEGDWPPCRDINRFVQGQTNVGSFDTLYSFSRWPTWMWANVEVVKLMDWLREYNDQGKNSVGFYGLDVYSLFESIDEVLKILNPIDPDLAARVKHFYSCFEPYKQDEKAYALSLLKYPEGCQAKALRALSEILKGHLTDEDNFFDVKQNAEIIKNAEDYYRSMIFEGTKGSSWNVRDRHMMDTLSMLLEEHEPEAKGIVWAHNTHIGDYRATDMLARGEINLGGLAREKYGPENVALVGFTTYEGTVTASHAWDGWIETMKVPRAKEGSLEYFLHHAIPQVGNSDYYMIFDQLAPQSPLHQVYGHRAIGVVYQPSHESYGNYVPTIPAQRYDALVYVNKSNAITPLFYGFDRNKLPETYPYGSRL